MIAAIDWRDAALIVAVVSTLGNAAFLFLRGRFLDDFARKGDVDALGGRVRQMEMRVESMPNHQDIQRLSDRVGGVERGVAVVDARLSGMEALLTRVDKGVHMLIEDHLTPGPKA